MPISYNIHAVLGAAVVGMISAAGLFVVEKIRQEKNRQKMAQDLARLDKELAQVKRELHELLGKQQEKKTRHRTKQSNKSVVSKANSIVSATSEDYFSSSNLDSSDLEFYDISDEDEAASEEINLEKTLESIDNKIDNSNLQQLEEILEKLEGLCIDYPQNYDLLYRIGKTHYRMIDRIDDEELIKNHLAKGIEACSQALTLNSNSAEVHKWYAILIGARSEYQSTQDRISDGYLFKKHVDAALALNPTDSSLHHMLGRFSFEIAGLEWYKRKVAAALFGEPPNATYAEAVEHFLEADKLANFEWKENKLMIAKCKIAQGEYKQAVEWLQKAASCKHGDGLDDKLDSEIKALLDKYNGYR